MDSYPPPEPNYATISVTEKEKELEELVGWNFGLTREHKYLDNCINNRITPVINVTPSIKKFMSRYRHQTSCISLIY